MPYKSSAPYCPLQALVAALLPGPISILAMLPATAPHSHVYVSHPTNQLQPSVRQLIMTTSVTCTTKVFLHVFKVQNAYTWTLLGRVLATCLPQKGTMRSAPNNSHNPTAAGVATDHMYA